MTQVFGYIAVIFVDDDEKSKKVTNWFYGGDTTLRLRIPVCIGYKKDIEQVEDSDFETEVNKIGQILGLHSLTVKDILTMES